MWILTTDVLGSQTKETGRPLHQPPASSLPGKPEAYNPDPEREVVPVPPEGGRGVVSLPGVVPVAGGVPVPSVAGRGVVPVPSNPDRVGVPNPSSLAMKLTNTRSPA